MGWDCYLCPTVNIKFDGCQIAQWMTNWKLWEAPTCHHLVIHLRSFMTLDQSWDFGPKFLTLQRILSQAITRVLNWPWVDLSQNAILDWPNQRFHRNSLVTVAFPVHHPKLTLPEGVQQSSMIVTAKHLGLKYPANGKCQYCWWVLKDRFFDLFLYFAAISGRGCAVRVWSQFPSRTRKLSNVVALIF